MTSNPRPLLVIGLDAADPGWLARWAGEGLLPNIAGLMRRGTWAETGGPETVSEHGIWGGLLSGISRADHGHYYFRELAPGTYDLASRDARTVDVPPFWCHPQLRDRPAVLVNVPEDRPRDERDDVQVCHWSVHNGWDPDRYPWETVPASLAPEITRRFGPPREFLEAHGTDYPDDVRRIERLMADLRVVGDLSVAMLNEHPAPLHVHVISQTHTAGHQAWRYRPGAGNRPADAGPDLDDALPRIYGRADEQVGRMIEAAGEDANVCLLSSVGLRDAWPVQGIGRAVLERLGYQVRPEETARQVEGEGLLSVARSVARRILPEAWRAAISGRLLSREARERIMAAQFREAIDFTRTRAFDLPTFFDSFIRLNVAGREPGGIVEDGPMRIALLEEIKAAFLALRDGDTGEPATLSVSTVHDLYGDRPDPNLPDLFVRWIEGRPLRSVEHPTAGRIDIPAGSFTRVSDHSRHGFCCIAGPGIEARGRQDPIDLLDVAPTLCRLLGVDPTPRMTGRVLDWVRGWSSDPP